MNKNGEVEGANLENKMHRLLQLLSGGAKKDDQRKAVFVIKQNEISLINYVGEKL